ncbi:MAG: hypothetical protein LJE84_03710 [Gammaproteobacteria bacterium]|jgi:uncharacterized protein|nr:hypothetical protein [Gammaproteobacteria bacterium]
MIRLFQIAVLVLLGWLLYAWVRGQLHRHRKRRQPPGAVSAQRMVPCAVCGVHVPENEALRRDGRYYCGPNHRDG